MSVKSEDKIPCFLLESASMIFKAGCAVKMLNHKNILIVNDDLLK